MQICTGTARAHTFASSSIREEALRLRLRLQGGQACGYIQTMRNCALNSGIEQLAGACALWDGAPWSVVQAVREHGQSVK